MLDMYPRGKDRERIVLTDTAPDMIAKLSEGNPGACTVCIGLISQNAQIDPISAFGPFSSILSLDSYRIYGADIWRLYKYVCQSDIVKCIALLRGCQLGFIPESDIHQAIQNNGGLDVDSVMEQVLNRLDTFWEEGREEFLSKRKEKVS